MIRTSLTNCTAFSCLMMPIREPMDGTSASTPSTDHYSADSQRPYIQSTVLHTLSHQSSTYHHPFNMTPTETASAVSRSVKQVGKAFYDTAMSYVSGWSANSEQPEKGSEIDQCMYILQSAITYCSQQLSKVKSLIPSGSGH